MSEPMNRPNRPIRVVMFGGGPTLEWGAEQFICRLEEHSEIEFLSAFCQSQGQSLVYIMQDLWNRRGLMAAPLLLLQALSFLIRVMRQPRGVVRVKKQLNRLSDRIHYVADIHAKDVLEEVRKFNPDLGLIYGSPILRPQLFQIPKYGTLGIHHGKVPEYRGKKTTFWAVYKGEEEAWVTIQKVNEGLDTGEIAKDGHVPIGSRSLGSIWQDLENLGLELYIQAILDVKQGNTAYRPQTGKKGKLYRDPKPGDIMRVWWLQSSKWISEKLG